MEPEDGAQVDTTESTEAAPVETSEAAPSTGGNPAWDKVRSELDPITFSRIEPILRDMDRGVQQRFDKNAQEYGWAKELQTQGLTPEYIKQAVGFAEQLNSNPEVLYQKIGEFLQQTGRMPNAAEKEVLAEEVEEESGAESVATLQLPPEVQQQLDELNQFKEQQTAFLQQQADEQLARESDQAIQTEIDQLKAAHPEYSDADVQEVLNRAVALMQQTGDIVPLSKADEEYSALLNRVRSTPRPGSLAPSLIPTSGGIPSGQAPPKLGDMSRPAVQDLIAGLLTQSKQS